MTRYRYIEDYVELPKIQSGKVSFAGRYPEIAKKWYYPLNRGFGPEELSPNSSIKVWWVCSENEEHLWQSSPNTIVGNGEKNNCPYCLRQTVSEDNNLEVCYPNLAKEWFTQRNKKSPDLVVAGGSHKRYWWRCSKVKSHIWQATIAQRKIGRGRCPSCNSKRLIDLRDFPIVLKQFDNEKNDGINPYCLSQYTRVWWKCIEDPEHTWRSTFNRYGKTKGKDRCPYCTNKLPSKTNNLSLNKQLAREFHPTKNGKLKPKDITLRSCRRVWWKCSKGRDHIWQTPVVCRGVHGTGCPFCAGHKVSYTNSFAAKNPLIAKEWHPEKNGDLTPKDITFRSGKLVWWQCLDFKDHEWQAKPSNRRSRISHCPFCKGLRVAKSNCLATKSPKVTKLWDRNKNGNIKPDQVYASSRKSYWFKCSKHGSYLADVAIMVQKGEYCPECRPRRKNLETNSLKSQLNQEL